MVVGLSPVAFTFTKEDLKILQYIFLHINESTKRSGSTFVRYAHVRYLKSYKEIHVELYITRGIPSLFCQ